MPNAPYFGGFSAGAQLFAVDGDFTQCDPCSLPEFSYPLRGDSILSIRDVVYFNDVLQTYVVIALGTFPNLQPWSPNQKAIVLEQEFMIAQSYYQPMRLNTPYDPSWATGWVGKFPDGESTVPLNRFYLVHEGELQDMGGGISKIKRTWATIPPVRNEVEQFTYSFIGYIGATQRSRIQMVVQSRVQYDYFIFDDWGVLSTPLFPNGNRLDGTTGLSPTAFILQAQYYYQNSNGIQTGNFTDDLRDGDGINPATATVPTLSAYQGVIKTDGTATTSNGLAAEIIAESSALCRFMGNIWERRTRFVIAQ